MFYCNVLRQLEARMDNGCRFILSHWYSVLEVAAPNERNAYLAAAARIGLISERLETDGV